MHIEDKYDGLDYINGTILLVTDDIDINIVLSGVFGLNGFKCLKSTNAIDALTLFEKYIDEIDSMIIDGKIAADRSASIILKSKQKKPFVKVIVVANSSNIKTRVLDYGADEFVLKPISAENLTNKVITQLARRNK